jgi:hypothetical protein
MWGCPTAVACEGYFVITDGTWTYYYSSYGGAFTGEVAVADAAFVSCPYGFEPPTSCAPVVAGQCASGPADAGSAEDAD